MIRIAILTPKNSYIKIKNSLKNLNYEIDYIFYDSLFQLVEIYNTISHKYDGIVTSGPLGYKIIINSTKITTPLYFLDISKGDFFKYLFKILKENKNIDFSRVYIDFISPEEKNKWIDRTFSKKEEPIFLPISYEKFSSYNLFKNNYLTLKAEKKIDFVLTRVSNAISFLKENNIPFYFIFPSSETIKSIILNVIKDIKIKKLEKNQIIFGKIQSNSNIKEIEKILKKFFKNSIIQINKNTLEILTLKENFNEIDISKILKEKINFEFFSGWGEGETIEEARYYCEESYKKNKLSDNQLFFLTNSKESFLLSKSSKNENSNFEILEKLISLNISPNISKNIIEFFKKEKIVSANTLSQYLNISERTSNRILKKLEETNLISSSILKIKRGRPKKIYKFL